MKHINIASFLMIILLFATCERDDIESAKTTLTKADIVFDKTYNDINPNSQRIIRNYDNDFFLYGWFHIIKVDENGNRKWAKELNHKDIAPTKDGGCIVITEESISQWNSELKMMKLDSEGNLLWEKSGANYEISKIVVGDNDEIYGIGDNQFPISHVFNATKPQLFKYTKDGDFLSSKWLIETDNHNFGQTICMLKLKNNKIVIGAMSKPSTESIGYDYCIIEFDLDANNIIEKYYGGYRDDYIMNIAETPDGGLMLMGYSNSKDGDIKSYRDVLDLNGSNGWVVKLGINREIEWEKVMGGSGGSTYFYKGIYYDNKYLVGYSTEITDIDFIGAERPKSGYISFDKSGNILNSKYIGAWSVNCEFNTNGELLILSSAGDEYYGIYNPRLIKIK